MKLVILACLALIACGGQKETEVVRDEFVMDYATALPPENEEKFASQTIWESTDEPRDSLTPLLKADSLMRWFAEEKDSLFLKQAKLAYLEHARALDVPTWEMKGLLALWDDTTRRDAVSPAVAHYTSRMITFLKREGYRLERRHRDAGMFMCRSIPEAVHFMKEAATRGFAEKRLWDIHWADLLTQEMECDNSGNSRSPWHYEDAYRIFSTYSENADMRRVAAEALDYHLTRYVTGHIPLSAMISEPDKWNPVALIEAKKWLGRCESAAGAKILEHWAKEAERENLRQAMRIRALAPKQPQQA
jgi:hypothetical protein